MAQLKLKGPQVGSDLGTIAATVGGASGDTIVESFLMPPPVTRLPRLRDGFDGDTITIDENGLTNVTARQWMSGGIDITGETGAALETSGLAGEWVSVRVSSAQGIFTSPPIMVYARGMMGMSMPESHIADDAAVLTIVPHAEATHIAVSDGNWTDPSVWNTGTVPLNGAFVLIPNRRTIFYDNTLSNIRLDRVRVDGTLNWVLDRSTTMLVETIVVTRGGTVTIGTSNSNRLPTQHSAEIIVSGKDYSQQSYTPTQMNPTRFSLAKGWERGLIVQGIGRFWGAEKLTWCKADPIEAGATSATLQRVPTGWQVGDQAIIGGTDISVSGSDITLEDEIVTLTGISGNTISWSGGLAHPHKNQLTGSTRKDCYPVIKAHGNKNIVIRSEVTSPEYLRGHTAYVHHHCTVDCWGVDFVDLGRTNKKEKSGIIDANGDFATENRGRSPAVNVSSLSETVNLQSRYPVHLHHVGFMHMGARPIVAECLVTRSPGWGFVHHSCDADLVDCAAHDIDGCAFVSESGNELGAWLDLLALGNSVRQNTPESVPKLRDEGLRFGDAFRFGYGFGYRGRAMRTNRCVANSVTWGHVFHHRGSTRDVWDGTTGANIAPPVDLNINYIDLKDQGMIGGIGNYRADEFSYVDYPIIHMVDNESIACVGGLHVTKETPTQKHDYNVNFKNFKAWGIASIAIYTEYIGNYLFLRPDVIAGNNPIGTTVGLAWYSNCHQIGSLGATIEGFDVGHDMLEGIFGNYAQDQTSPRWYMYSANYINVGTEIRYDDQNDDGTLNATATVINDDFDGTAVDFDLNPSEDYPLVAIEYVDDVWITDADGGKTDNLSSNVPILNKSWGDRSLVNSFDRGRFDPLSDKIGYWNYLSGRAVKTTGIIGDRLTARPHKTSKLVHNKNGGSFTGTNLGTFTLAGTPATASNVAKTAVKNGSVVINIADASPANGNGTYTLDDRDIVKPDHGIVVVDRAAGTITYSPDRDYEGTEFFYFFIESGHTYATVRADILIGGDEATLDAPAIGINFTVADGADANTVEVTCTAPPDAGGRRILLVQYSTDGGSTWCRLSSGWKQAVHKITVESDETPISDGGYNLRLRYQTDYDYSTSGASGDASITVS